MNESNENHLRDGEWKGFYNYSTAGTKHNMSCFFTFKNGIINGHGNDDVGNHTWSGSYDDDHKVKMIKTYPTHAVEYTGDVDENGIWGKWKITKTSGGFHLWPVSQNADDFSEEKTNEEVEELVYATVEKSEKDFKK